jgi:hypothetical protein
MMLVNEKLVNKKVATEFGYMVFDEKGETNDLTAEQQAKLGALPGFTYVEDKKEEKKEEPKEPAKVEVKEVKKPAPKKNTKKEEK